MTLPEPDAVEALQRLRDLGLRIRETNIRTRFVAESDIPAIEAAIRATPSTDLDVERLARALWAWGFDATGPVIRDDVKEPTEGQRRMARKLAAEYRALACSKKGEPVMDPQRAPEVELPFPTTDARLWAAEFVRLHGGDEELMLGWFANAIEHGREAISAYKAELRERVHGLASPLTRANGVEPYKLGYTNAIKAAVALLDED